MWKKPNMKEKILKKFILKQNQSGSLKSFWDWLYIIMYSVDKHKQVFLETGSVLKLQSIFGKISFKFQKTF